LAGPLVGPSHPLTSRVSQLIRSLRHHTTLKFVGWHAVWRATPSYFQALKADSPFAAPSYILGFVGWHVVRSTMPRYIQPFTSLLEDSSPISSLLALPLLEVTGSCSYHTHVYFSCQVNESYTSILYIIPPSRLQVMSVTVYVRLSQLICLSLRPHTS
jgi:hypothetical protein